VRERWGDELRIARLRRRESQAEAAAAVGVAGPTVHKAETGRASVDIYDRLARYYELTLELGQPA